MKEQRIKRRASDFTKTSDSIHAWIRMIIGLSVVLGAMAVGVEKLQESGYRFSSRDMSVWVDRFKLAVEQAKAEKRPLCADDIPMPVDIVSERSILEQAGYGE